MFNNIGTPSISERSAGDLLSPYSVINTLFPDSSNNIDDISSLQTSFEVDDAVETAQGSLLISFLYPPSKTSDT